ncbi:hypothetical protein [Pseudoxanthomonas sp.]|uniref:hypothetical protein n=1 Tax=Pseudoxanthomonas sp. TaxID=1871049 RepID=UPI0025889FB5|nr:hypothetical protein [Pseudoxanthomonas sp.]MCR6686476.1 hypothetical protein [Pseudoxanthomonas sp.]
MTLPAAGDSPWSPRQRYWLQALGHVVYRHGEVATEAPVEADVTPAEAFAGAGAADARARAASPARPQPPDWRDDAPRRAPSLDDAAGVRERPVPSARVPADAAQAGTEAGARQATAARRMPRLPDRLQLALLRASGLDPSDPAAQAAMAQWPVERLRQDPAAKRAFWPQLRALRKRP